MRDITHKFRDLHPITVEQVNWKSLDKKTAESIRNLILNGHIPPGTHLTETDLAERLGVSRGTVRTAFKQLRHEGLLAYHPNRGVFVIEITAEDIWEIYTLRNHLEALATELATGRLTEEGKTRLRTLLDQMKSAAEADEYDESHRLDWEFHRLVMELSRHRRLQELYRLVEIQTRLFLSLTKGFHLNAKDIVALHEPIIAALLAGNTAEAIKLAMNHNTSDGKKLIEQLQRESEPGEKENGKGFHSKC